MKVNLFLVWDKKDINEWMTLNNGYKSNKWMILNLLKFKKFVNYKHFNIESINKVINLIKPNVYTASIDLKDAFFFQYVSTMIIKNILSSYLKICFNWHP